jgi:glycosyltransferase involved in cell wall biosynthesis
MQNLFKKSIVWNLYKGPIFFEDIRNLRPKESFSLFNNVMLLYSLTPSFIIKKGANIPQVKKIITWSTRMKNHLRTIGIPQNKVSVIPSGVDIRVFKPLSDEKREDLKVEWRFNQDNLIVFYYGLLSTLRGLDILISSFLDEIAWRVPDARLLILGRECQDISRLRASYLKKAKNSDKILLIEGTQPRSIVREALALSDVVALPFKLWPHQDCPSTVLEAMAMAKPLITTYTGSLPEIVKNGKTGILIPPGNTKALSQAILKLLSDNKFSRQIGRTARLYVKRFYDWNVVLKQTICVFRKVLNENTD